MADRRKTARTIAAAIRAADKTTDAAEQAGRIAPGTAALLRGAEEAHDDHDEEGAKDAIIEAWHEATVEAEATDEWDAVAAIEKAMRAMGIDPAAEADPSHPAYQK